MNIVIMYIAVILAAIAVIVFGVWLHRYVEDTDFEISLLLESKEARKERIESLDKQVSSLRKQQEAMQAYINTMPHPKHRYGLNPEERDLIAGVIEAEAGGEDWTGKVLIAQCLLNACEKDDIRPIQAIRTYQYAKARPVSSELSKAAVRFVFDEGETVTEQPVLYFYAPARCKSAWHESQRYLFEHGGHRFFTTKED